MAYRASAIKSIQKGSIALTSSATSNTATITAVDTANSILVLDGQTYTLNSTTAKWNRCRVALTNATTVTVVRAEGNAAVPTVYFSVIEYFPGILKSVQRGTISLNNVTSQNATITAVVTAKSYVSPLGFSTLGTDNYDMLDIALQLTAATTVNASRYNLEALACDVGYQVVEYK